MELEEELEMALQRVVNEKQLKYIPQLEHALTLAQQKERILAAQILGGLTSHFVWVTSYPLCECEKFCVTALHGIVLISVCLMKVLGAPIKYFVMEGLTPFSLGV